jgi:hypothetical protein
MRHCTESGTVFIGGKNMYRFVIFIDGENISWKTYEFIISAVKALGEIFEKRVYIYGNWSEPTMKGWEKNLDKYQAIPVSTFRKGKNATDASILMEATEMDILNKEINAFCIVSSDAIYQHLAHRLRTHGKYVLGIGEEKSPDKWRESCSDFKTLSATRDIKPHCE